MKYTLAILTGGTSSEREVAFQSAASVKTAIGPRATVEIFDIPKQLDEFLAKRQTIDCVIPVFHGRGGEDGSIQGFLETLGMPYIFSTVAAHALAIDKVKTNIIVDAAGIRVPKNTLLTQPTIMQWSTPVVIKPNDNGSSIGITIAHSPAELEQGLAEAWKHSNQVMVEEYITGKEYSVAVIEVDGTTIALPVISITPKHEFFDYESKYRAGLTEEKCPADISTALSERLQQTALRVHHAISARHVTRSDYIVDEQGAVWFIDVNTIPGMSALLPMPIVASGRDFGEVLIGWVKSVLVRS